MASCILTTPIRPSPTTFPPLGSMAIIQALRSVGEETNFLHIDYHRYDNNYLEEYFEKNKFDFIGVSAVVSTAYAYTKYIINLIKLKQPNAVVFVGGNLAASSEVVLRYTKADFCIIGDGEVIIENLIPKLKKDGLSKKLLSTVKGLSFIDEDNNLKFTGYEHPLPAPLLETPDWTILEKENCLDHYIGKNLSNFEFFIGKTEKNSKKATIVVAKGCVARCTFCHRFEKGYRVQPNEKVLEHIKFLKKKYSITHLDIGDENFGSYKKETEVLVKQFKELGLEWRAAGVRAHTVSLELLKFYKENGCKIIIYGIESGSPKMLEVMEKKIKRDQNINAIKWTYQAGLSTVIQLVIGMPGEDDKTIDETIEFLNIVFPYYPDYFRKIFELRLSVNYAQALPGTPLYEYARENGYLKRDVKSEEDYLLSISDRDAYDNDHFINYTQQPLLKVYTWKHKIFWKLWRRHAKENLKLNFKKIDIIFAIVGIIASHIFRFKFKNKIINEMNKYNQEPGKEDHVNSMGKKNLLNYLLNLLLPWNKFTYPVIASLIAYKEAQNIKWFIKLILEHLVWSLNIFKKIQLPDKTLRKIVNIKDTDDSLLLRKGR